MLKPSVTRYEYSILDYVVKDADTISTLIDLGFCTFHQSSCRLHGVDGPELKHVSGKLVARVTYKWLERFSKGGLIVTSMAKDKYAERYVGRIKAAQPDGNLRCLNDFLISNQLVKEYNGKTKIPWDTNQMAEVEERAIKILWDRFSVNVTSAP